MVEKRNEKERFPFVFNFGQRFVQVGIFGALLQKALLHMFSFSMLLAFAFIYKNISWFRSFYLIPLSFPCSCLPSFLLPLLLSFFLREESVSSLFNVLEFVFASPPYVCPIFIVHFFLLLRVRFAVFAL